jgi:hypothetical protein
MICLWWMSKAYPIRSSRFVPVVVMFRPSLSKLSPCSSGLVGLMVATSKDGSASRAIGLAGWGMSHAVSLLARTRTSGSGLRSSVHTPTIEFPSALNLPEKLTSATAMAKLTVSPFRPIDERAIGSPPSSMLYNVPLSFPSSSASCPTMRRSFSLWIVPCQVPAISCARSPCTGTVINVTANISFAFIIGLSFGNA